MVQQTSQSNESHALGVYQYSKLYKSLIVPNQDVLEDTLSIVSRLVGFSSRVLPIKSYFNLCQYIQRRAFFSIELAKKMAPSKSKDTRALQAIVNEFRNKSMANIIAELGEDFNRTEHASKLIVCTEDVFIITCSYLDLEVSKHASVYYLPGRGSELKDSKKGRVKQDIQNEHELKKLSSVLAKPDELRGEVEQCQIVSGYNYLVHLNNLHTIASEVKKWVQDGLKTKSVPRQSDIKRRYKLTQNELNEVMSIARNNGMPEFKNNKRSPENKFFLTTDNYETVLKYAEGMDKTPQQMLNIIVHDFFKLISNRRMADALDR